MADEIPEPFRPSPHLDEAVNQAIIESELQGGARLSKLAVGRRLLIQTQHTRYVLDHVEPEIWMLSGHPKYCPVPVRAVVHGSTWGGSMLKFDWVGIGMHLEVGLGDLVITTSEIQSVTEDAIPT